MEEPNLHQQVQQYLSGELNDQERLAFEEACRTQPELKEALTTELHIRFAVQQHAREGLNKVGEEKVSSPSWLYPYRWAAVFIGLICLSIALYVFWPSPEASTDLFAEYYELPTLSQARAGEVSDSLWQGSLTAYQNRDWDEAESRLEVYLAQDSIESDSQGFLLLGICQLEQEKFTQAQESFSQIEESLHPYYYDARWYSALSYLRSGEDELARKQLALVSPSKVYGERAKEILNRLSQKR